MSTSQEKPVIYQLMGLHGLVEVSFFNNDSAHLPSRGVFESLQVEDGVCSCANAVFG